MGHDANASDDITPRRVADQTTAAPGVRHEPLEETMTDPRSSRAGKPRHRRPTPVGLDGPGAMDTTSRATPAAYTPDVAVPPAPPAEEAIRTRAYELYLARGGTPGHELEDWLAAEHALRPAEDRGRPTA